MCCSETISSGRLRWNTPVDFKLKAALSNLSYLCAFDSVASAVSSIIRARLMQQAAGGQSSRLSSSWHMRCAFEPVCLVAGSHAPTSTFVCDAAIGSQRQSQYADVHCAKPHRCERPSAQLAEQANLV